MLSFKDLKAEKLSDPEFKEYYESECHICGITMAIVSRILDMGDGAKVFLERLGISRDQFNALAEGDRCDPDMVRSLEQSLGMGKPETEHICPRRSTGDNVLDRTKEGSGNGRQ